MSHDAVKAVQRLTPAIHLQKPERQRYVYRNRYGEYVIRDQRCPGGPGKYDMAVCEDESAAVIITEALNAIEADPVLRRTILHTVGV